MSEKGWLIEASAPYSQPQWLRIIQLSSNCTKVIWTTDSDIALRFSRKIDAELFWFLCPQPGVIPVITEHAWGGVEMNYADHDAAIAQLTRERDEARATLKHREELDAFTKPLSCETHGLVVNLASFGNKCAECQRDTLAADLALTREALDWALSEADAFLNSPPHLAAILDASRKRVCGHE
jgi:hypothetical protein